MIVLSDMGMQQKADQLRNFLVSAFNVYQGKAVDQPIVMKDVDDIIQELNQYLATYPKALSHQVQTFNAILIQTKHSLKQLIEFNADCQMEKLLRHEQSVKAQAGGYFFGIFKTLFQILRFNKNMYYQHILKIALRSKHHVLPKSLTGYALGCCDHLMLLIERYYFSWLVIMLGVHDQVRQVRGELIKLYDQLKKSHLKKRGHIWQLHHDNQPIQSMNFVEKMMLEPQSSPLSIFHQYWQGEVTSGADWWAKEIIGLSEPNGGAMKAFVQQNGDVLMKALVRQMSLELKCVIEQEGLSRFYSSTWSSWIHGLNQQYQQWSFLDHIEWKITLSQLHILSKNSEHAFKWASCHQTEGEAGEYRQAMVGLGFKMKGGVNQSV